MTFKTEAAVLRSATGTPEYESVVLDDLREDEVLVEMHACGICHMDLEAAEFVELPAIFGHEGAGVIVAVGSDVENVSPGDRVIAGYGFCGHCPPCDHHQPYFCDSSWPLTFSGRRLDGTPTIFDASGAPLSGAFFQQSSFARHAITLARSVVKIGVDVPWPVAAAIPCGFMTGVGSATNVLAVDSSASLLIRGVGAVGLGAVVGAVRQGCQHIVACDVRQNRLALAAKYGAIHALDVSQVDLDEWRQEHFPRGFTHILDTTGRPEVFRDSPNQLATGGDLAYAILPAPMEAFEFRPFELFVRCASLKAVSFGSAAPAEILPVMLDWWRQGLFDVEASIGTFNFQDLPAALAAAASGEVIKPVLVMT